LENQLTERATQWRDTLANETPRARAALRELLAGPIRFVPQRTGSYELRGSTPLGALLFGPGGTRVKMASPRVPARQVKSLFLEISGRLAA